VKKRTTKKKQIEPKIWERERKRNGYGGFARKPRRGAKKKVEKE